MAGWGSRKKMQVGREAGRVVAGLGADSDPSLGRRVSVSFTIRPLKEKEHLLREISVDICG